MTDTTDNRPARLVALRTIAKGCLERLDALDITGPKRRTDAALHYMVGAAFAAEAAGDPGLAQTLKTHVYFLSIQGMRIVEEAAARPDDDVLDQIKAFAAVEGKGWKDALNRYWMRGEPVPNFPLLYGLRNHPDFGPSWLASFRL